MKSLIAGFNMLLETCVCFGQLTPLLGYVGPHIGVSWTTQFYYDITREYHEQACTLIEHRVSHT